MTRQSITRFLREQQLYLVIAAIFWALGIPMNPVVTIEGPGDRET